MRRLIARLGLGLTLLAPVAACDIWKQVIRDEPRPSVPANARIPEATALVKYMNDNAALVAGIQCNRVAMDCKAGRQAIGLDGMLACQKPKNFRLQGLLVGNPAVDIGSNNDEFWYWMKNPDSRSNSQLFFCNYSDLATGKITLPFPFQPDMVVAALGIAEYDPRGTYEVKLAPSGKYLELIESARSAQGEPIQRVTVFNAVTVPAGQPQVIAHVLRDAKGKVICQATIEAVQITKPSGAVLPYKVKLEWPAQDMSMKMTLGDMRVVAFSPQQTARLFSRADLKYESVDLATARPDIRRVEGTVPPRR